MIELKHISQFPVEIIATDEVGRGPLGGPVVIGAIRLVLDNAETLKSLSKFLRPKGVTDSKKLSPEMRHKVLTKLGIPTLEFRQVGLTNLKGIEVSFVSWEMDHSVIDQENILAASLRGMKEAAFHLSDKKMDRTVVFIDGHMKLRWGKEISPWNEVPIIKGDSKSVLIGLASIIAKEKRDAFMRSMHEIYPHYGFAQHFGYPTSSHRAAIAQHGPCEIHRKTFKGVSEFLGTKAGAESLA
jgi:ribonuclease HII